jgi:hypothetical protein
LAPELIEPYDTARRFLQLWIVDRDTTKATSQYISLSDVSAQFRGCGLAATDSGNWLSTFLTRWLIADHGFVNRKGHGWPGSDYRVLPLNPQQAEIEAKSQRSYRIFKFGKLDDAIAGAFSGSTFDFVTLTPVRSAEAQYAIVFKFRHTPHDGLVLLMQRRNGALRITSLFWFTS